MTKIDVSALEADLKAMPPANSKTTCRVQELVADHPEAAELIRAAITNTHYAARAVSRVLLRNGLEISEGTIQKHRRGECTVCKRLAPIDE